MPNFDKTGPSGKGPMTGCGMGVCTEGSPAGRMGFRKRMRRGCGPIGRFMSYEDQKKFFEEKLEAIRKFKNNFQK